MSISDDEFDQLPPWGTTLSQKIVEFLGKERGAFTAEEVIKGLGPEHIVRIKIPRPHQGIPGDQGESVYPIDYSLEVVTTTLSAMVQELGARANPRRPLEARYKDDVRYYRLRR